VDVKKVMDIMDISMVAVVDISMAEVEAGMFIAVAVADMSILIDILKILRW
jgi:hypothetical protein